MEPTPDSVSSELIIWSAVFIVPVIASFRSFRLLNQYGLFLLVAFAIGTLSAIRASADSTQFIRDVISFMFWILGPMLVLFVTSRSRDGRQVIGLEQLRIVLALSGAILSARYLADQGVGIMVAFQINLRMNLEYLSSEPLVTYAFIYAAFAAFRTERIISNVGFIILFMISSLGLIAVTYRGPLLLGGATFIFSACFFSISHFKSSPIRTVMVLMGMFVAMYFLGGRLADVAAKILGKFESVGTNSKLDEFFAVFSSGNGAWEVILGNGFGGIGFLEGAGTITGYTHNILSYAYLKIGYVGLFLVVAAIAKALAVFTIHYKLALRYLPEILTILYIGLFQAAFKHFGYGLLLGVCIAVGRAVAIRRRATVVSRIRPG